MKSSLKQMLIVLILVISASVVYSAQPKNIIIMIADGWSRNHIDAADYYQYGEKGSQVYEKFPVQLFVSTYLGKFNNKDDKDYSSGYNSYLAWTDFQYIASGATESAGAGTAMATGKKTYARAIGVDVNGKVLQNISEYAKSIGKSAGVVTSVHFSDATPSTFTTHCVERDKTLEISTKMLTLSKLDVLMGCGNPDYDNDGKPAKNDYKYVGGEQTWQEIKSGKSFWKLIQSKEEFQKMANGDTPDRVLGVPMINSNLQSGRSGDSKAEPFKVPLTQNVPSLKEMSLAALNVLDNNQSGLFLMIEGGAVDWASHSNLSGRMIEEMIDFNFAVEGVVEWVENNSSWDETLLIVTGDHECGYLTGPGSDPEFHEVQNNGKGNLPGMEWHSGSHTNQLIPVFAKGQGSMLFHQYADEYDLKRGAYITNSEIGQLMFRMWEK